MPPFYMPSIVDGLRFVAPLRSDARTIHENGISASVAPTTESIDAAGTYLDPITGLITDALANVLRTEKNGALLETERTNLATRTEELDHADWALTRVTIAANDRAAPDGATTADKLVEDGTASDTHALGSPGVDFVSGTVYTYSVFVRAAERTEILISGNAGPFAANTHAWFDLSGGGSVGSIGAGADKAKIKAFAGGWFRLSVTATSGNTQSGRWNCFLGSGGETSVYTGDGTSGAHVWGLQIEPGSLPSSYIPTTTAPVTRAKDLLMYPASGNIPSNQSFSVIIAITPGFDSTNVAFSATILDTVNQAGNWGVRILWRSDLRWECLVRNATGYSARLFSSAAFSQGDHVVLIATIETDSMKLYDNGVLKQTDLSGLVPLAHQQIVIGADNNDSMFFIGNLAHVMIYDRVLSANEIETLTSEIQSWLGV